jgi:WD40 repeat protein
MTDAETYFQPILEPTALRGSTAGVAGKRTAAWKAGAGAIPFCLLLLLTGQLAMGQVQRAELVVQTGHSSGVLSVAFSPDGKTLASGSYDTTIKLWEVGSGRELRTLSGTSSISSLAFSPDGKTLASGSGDLLSHDNTIMLWEVESGRELRTLSRHSGKVFSLAFSPDGKTLASGSLDKTIKLWDVESGREMRTLNTDGVFVAFSPDGKTLAGDSGDTIKLWDVTSGIELRTLKGQSNAVWSVAFSPDGKTLASGSETQIKLWDVTKGRELRRLTGHSSEVLSVAFSPDGKMLASCSETQIKLWDVTIGTELRTLGGQHWGDKVNSVAFSPDGMSLASGSDDGDISLWDVTSGRESRTFPAHFAYTDSVAFSPDGKTLTSKSTGGTIKLWDLTSGRELRTLTGHSDAVLSVAFSPDGKSLATGSEDKTIKLWDLSSGTELRTLTGHSDRIYSLAFSPDGKTLASGAGDGTIKLWDVTNGTELRTLLEHSGEVFSLAFSPDGKTLASGAGDGTIKLWDVTNRTELHTLTGHSSAVESVVFSPDGKTLASGSGRTLGHINEDKTLKLLKDKTIKLWDVSSGTELRTFTGHSSGVLSVAFSPDGKTLASGSEDHTIKLWEVESGRERTLSGHTGWVHSVAFSPDGKTLASGSGDTKIKLWDVQSGRELGSLIALNQNDWAIVTPDGRFDTDLLDHTEGLHWVMKDAPMTTLPLEIFMRDYYEPGLLPRLLKCTTDKEHPCDKEFKPVRDISTLNRVQPPVEIKNVSMPDPEGYVNVTVAVGRSEGKFLEGGKEISRTTDVYDVCLFRDGQLVATWPNDGAERLLAQTAKDLKVDAKLSDNDKMSKEERDWQHATRVELDANGKKTLTARVRLPKGKDATQIEFTAYAFNENRVKSQTAKWTWPAEVIAKLPKAQPVKPHAYVITVGVNASENPAWSLQYAANDALKMGETLSVKLKQLKQGDGVNSQYDVVTLPLVSDYQSDGAKLKVNDATKEKIQAVFDLLAGHKVDEKLLSELKTSVPQVSQLKKSEPDDLVLISFSSHGYTDRNGNFFILPYNIGSSSEITPDLLLHSISSEELSLWLRDVDAGEMVMIIDACHAAAFTGKDFKPGPMGSRGLGQLSYDKGMRILTATQAKDAAIESSSIGQGLLSYALIHDGLEGGLADFKPLDQKITIHEWLEYGVSRVPELYRDVASGKLKAIDRAVIVGSAGETKSFQQQPSLFDFSRKRADVILSSISK